AEDGIRDDLVTGVQTCALPICAFAKNVGRIAKARLSDVTNVCALARALRAPEPRSSACVPCGFVGWKYPLHDSTTENRPRWCNEIGRASCRESGESLVGADALE